MKIRTRARSAVAIGGAAVCVIALGTVGATSAAFLQQLTASGSLSGEITVAQGPNADQIYDDPENPNIVVTVNSGSNAAVLTTLAQDGIPNPTRSTGGFSLTAGLLDGSADANIRVAIDAAPDASDWAREHLRLGVYLNGEILNPDGVPLTMDQIDAIGGVDIGTLTASDSPSTIEYRIWLGPEAPSEAYGSQLTLNATLIGETVEGDVFDMNVEV
ncbi:hypothetical protein ACWGOE_13545 [Leucobacter chromiiresistens]